MTDVHTPSEVSAETFGEDAVPGLAGNGGNRKAEVPQASWGWFRWAWRQLTSMRTALVLLFLLALGAIPGSLLPQEGTDPASVQNYFTAHPALAPWLNHLGLFNVYAAPWFAAIYLLLFASLIGCVVPRTLRLAGTARTPPPRAPRNLSRLPHSASYSVALPAGEAADAAAAYLSGKRFRLRRPADGDQASWISAEKGYLREAGNLLFHLSLLGVLCCIAVGGLFGYKADKLMVEGQTFSDTVTSLDEWHPGRLVSGSDLAPFSITLNKFSASYYTSGQSRGEPSTFDASIDYSSSPGGPAKPYNLRINQPLNVDSTKVYLIGHGYAPEFTVTDAKGKVVYQEATPFIPQDTSTLLSDGVVKVAGATPQLGFMGVFVPSPIDVSGELQSYFPAAQDPVVSLIGYAGNLGINSGIPQSVYQLDTTAMTQLTAKPFALAVGQSYTLPDGQGKITFDGYKNWVSLQVTYDPGQVPALICGILALAGLLLSFLVRRRRLFVRSVPAGDGSLVTIGGLARTDASGGFEDEFAEVVTELRAIHGDKAVPVTAAEPPAHEVPTGRAESQAPGENQTETGA
ncbi:MAG TPA: cytochrome c biogenesis protein ResB [Trebonia sp.]|nr:cytochrome c biogenesis protein ResB [Trebonia sp.]